MARLIVSLPATALDAPSAAKLIEHEVRIPQLSEASRRNLTSALVSLAESVGPSSVPDPSQRSRRRLERDAHSPDSSPTR